MAKADTFDIMVLDVATTYEQYLNDKNNKTTTPELYSQEDLESRLKSVRTG